MSQVDVVIATPGGSLTGQYVKSLLETIGELSNRGISSVWLNRHASHVADAREITLANTLENSIHDSRPLHGALEYKKIFWIDSDISWQPADFMRLYDSDFDIVSGAYMLATGEVTAYPERLKSGFSVESVLKMSEPVKVHSVGFGFLAVKSGIFERLSRPWFQSVPVTLVDPGTGKEFAFPIMGEDISWCERVGRLGYDIWFDPTVRVTHHKNVALTWSGVMP